MTEKLPTSEAGDNFNGMRRRTVTSGAAWTVPVIAAAVAAPMASASPAQARLTIAPNVVLMGTNTTISLVVTLEAASGAVNGENVAVLLPNGFVFSGTGSTSKTATTDPSGSIRLDDVSSIGAPASGSIVATLGADPRVTASASIRSTSSNVVFWGQNEQGQVGTTPPTLSSRILAPTVSTSFPGVATRIGATESGVTAVDSAGRAHVVGYNSDYRLGDGTTVDRSQYVPAVGITGSVSYLEANGVEERSAFAITADGTVWANGWNEASMFASSTVADGATTRIWTRVADLVPVLPGEKIVKVVQSNYGSALYLLSSGEAYASGSNEWGTTAQGTDSGKVVAGRLLIGPGVALTDTKRVADVAQGEGSLLVVTSDGELWACGENDQGAVPNQRRGTRTTYLHPVTLPSGKTAAKVFAQEDFSFVIMTDGTVYAQGRNNDGALGVILPQGPVDTLSAVILPDGAQVTKIASGNDGTIFLLADGRVFFAGLNDTSGAGHGAINVPAERIYTPLQVPLPGDASDITATWWDGYAALLR